MGDGTLAAGVKAQMEREQKTIQLLEAELRGMRAQIERDGARDLEIKEALEALISEKEVVHARWKRLDARLEIVAPEITAARERLAQLTEIYTTVRAAELVESPFGRLEALFGSERYGATTEDPEDEDDGGTPPPAPDPEPPPTPTGDVDIEPVTKRAETRPPEPPLEQPASLIAAIRKERGLPKGEGEEEPVETPAPEPEPEREVPKFGPGELQEAIRTYMGSKERVTAPEIAAHLNIPSPGVLRSLRSLARNGEIVQVVKHTANSPGVWSPVWVVERDRSEARKTADRVKNGKKPITIDRGGIVSVNEGVAPKLGDHDVDPMLRMCWDAGWKITIRGRKAFATAPNGVRVEMSKQSAKNKGQILKTYRSKLRRGGIEIH